MPEFDVTDLLLPLAEQGVKHCHYGRALVETCQSQQRSDGEPMLLLRGYDDDSVDAPRDEYNVSQRRLAGSSAAL